MSWAKSPASNTVRIPTPSSFAKADDRNLWMADFRLGSRAGSNARGLFGRDLPRFSRLDLCRAELEFRNLSEWIERRIGQDICRSFHKGKRNEYDAIRDAIVLARIELDFAAARGDAHHVARLDAELGKGAARE